MSDVQEKEDRRDFHQRMVSCFDPTIKENWRLPPFFNLTQVVEKDSGEFKCTIDFNRAMFTQMANGNRKELPLFFPLPYDMDLIKNFLNKKSNIILTTAIAFPFPNVHIRAPPLYAALVSFGTPMMFTTQHEEHDLHLSSAIFSTFAITTWTDMIHLYASTLLVLGETPTEVAPELYKKVIDAFTWKITRLFELLNECIFKNNIDIQNYCKRITKGIKIYQRLSGNAANPFPRKSVV